MLAFDKRAQELFSFTRDIRRDLHRHPELGFQETRTAGVIERELKAIPHLQVQTGVGKTGVVGLLEGNGPGPVVLLRVDMDALPIAEENDVPYASRHEGVMHACGHDGHVAMGLTAARLLSEVRDQFPGTVKFVFQPAEEGLGGAQSMIDDGVLEDPRPDYTLSLHLWNEERVGWVALPPGPMMAASETVHVRLTGKGGHGASPHTAIDPILASAQIISGLQSVVAREISPLDSGVISITSVHGGSSHNIIPPVVEMEGTTRTFRSKTREYLLERFQTIVSGVAETFRCEAEIQIDDISPAVVNDPQVTALYQEAVRALYPDMTIETQYQTMGAEDMALMMAQVPGCYMLIGSANPEKGLDAKHHHPRFDFDEEALTRGAALISGAAYRVLTHL
jgi:amidohydrolase